MTVTLTSTSIVSVIETNASKIVKEKSCCSLKELLKWKEILTEIISTALLMLLGCMACVPIDGLPHQTPLYAPLGFGLVVLFNVHTFGHISGAHMNPVVTITAYVRGFISFGLGLGYIAAQHLGAILGYGILLAVSPVDVVKSGICITQPHKNHNVYQAIGVEIALTGALCLACCAAWDPVNKRHQDSMPLKFGLIVCALSIAGGPLTGASMNPARSLAPALWTNIWTYQWVYWVGPLLGCAIALVIYWLISTNTDQNKAE